MNPEMNTGWNLNADAYTRMRERRPEVWRHALEWLHRHAPRSVLEIGGGDGRLAQLLPPATDYLNIDPNAGIVHDKTRRADWQTVDKAPYTDRFDVIISLATINHVRNAYAFLDGILQVRPRALYVSFWVSLSEGPCNVQEEIHAGPTPGGGHGYYIRTQFSRRSITAWCTLRRVPWKIERVGADDVLLVEDLRP